jgi:hypothetical protein
LSQMASLRGGFGDEAIHSDSLVACHWIASLRSQRHAISNRRKLR